MSFTDMTLIDSESNSSGAAITLTGVVENSLIIAIGQQYQIQAAPQFELEGVKAASLGDYTVSPFNAHLVGSSLYRYWYLRRYHWGWGRFYWHDFPAGVRIQMWIAEESGTVTITPSSFTGAAWGSFDCYAYNTNYTPAVGNDVESLRFIRSAQLPEWVRRRRDASIPVQTDDLVLVMGEDIRGRYPSTAINLSGVTLQTLVDFSWNNATWSPLYSDRMKLVRVKSDGNLQASFSHLYGGLSMYRLYANVLEVKQTPPTVAETLTYFELKVPMTATGQRMYPEWFQALRDSMADDYENFGIVDTFAGGVIEEQENSDGARPAEQWEETVIYSMPQAQDSLIGAGALIFDDEAEMRTRLSTLEKGW